ncbi:MAG: methyltransferase domain-containing protein [Chloroflexi bacterium]|nr:methyltransferase domain-containing protein [Chloroflexota bacterium]
MLPLDRQNEYRRRYRALNPRWQPSGDAFEQIVRHAISPATRLLDLGGGRGGLIEKIHAEVGAATALDPDLLSLRQHRVPAVPRSCGLAESLPFRAESFDVITALWLLEHLPDPVTAFSEIHRVLAPNGLFIFLTPNALHPLLTANYLSRFFPSLQRALIPRLYARAEADTFPVRYRANTAAALRALCRRVDFTLELRFIADPTYTAFNDPLFRLSAFVERFIPAPFRIHLIGVAQKKASGVSKTPDA